MKHVPTKYNRKPRTIADVCDNLFLLANDTFYYQDIYPFNHPAHPENKWFAGKSRYTLIFGDLNRNGALGDIVFDLPPPLHEDNYLDLVTHYLFLIECIKTDCTQADIIIKSKQSEK